MTTRTYRIPLQAKSVYTINVPVDFSKIARILVRLTYIDVPEIGFYPVAPVVSWEIPGGYQPQGPLDFIDFRTQHRDWKTGIDSGETYISQVQLRRGKGLCIFTYDVLLRYPWSHDVSGNTAVILMNKMFSRFPFVVVESWIDIVVR